MKRTTINANPPPWNPVPDTQFSPFLNGKAVVCIRYYPLLKPRCSNNNQQNEQDYNQCKSCSVSVSTTHRNTSFIIYYDILFKLYSFRLGAYLIFLGKSPPFSYWALIHRKHDVADGHLNRSLFCYMLSYVRILGFAMGKCPKFRKQIQEIFLQRLPFMLQYSLWTKTHKNLLFRRGSS